MSKNTISALVDGGKASAGAPLGPALGPLGVNIGDVVSKINEKTAVFAGMKVPVNVIVEMRDKSFDIEVGSPPISALLKKQISLEKGSEQPGKEIVKDATLDDIVVVAKSKMNGLFSKTLKSATKEVLGSCLTMGITVEGKDPREIQKLITKGEFDSKLEE